MGSTIKELLVLIALIVISYGFIAFIALELNPLKWGETHRLGLSVLIFVIILCRVIWVILTNKNDS